MENKMIEEVLEFVEDTLETIEGEYGKYNFFHEILRHKPYMIPDFYFKLKQMHLKQTLKEKRQNGNL